VYFATSRTTVGEAVFFYILPLLKIITYYYGVSVHTYISILYIWIDTSASDGICTSKGREIGSVLAVLWRKVTFEKKVATFIWKSQCIDSKAERMEKE